MENSKLRQSTTSLSFLGVRDIVIIMPGEKVACGLIMSVLGVYRGGIGNLLA